MCWAWMMLKNLDQDCETLRCLPIIFAFSRNLGFDSIICNVIYVVDCTIKGDKLSWL